MSNQEFKNCFQGQINDIKRFGLEQFMQLHYIIQKEANSEFINVEMKDLSLNELDTFDSSNLINVEIKANIPVFKYV